MPSAVAKGQAWKLRTKKWLEGQGYVVALLERMLSVWTPHGVVHTKRDQLGSDLIAVSCEKTWFVQVKGGLSARSQLAAARAEFAKYPLGPGCEQVVICWPPRAHVPDVDVVAVGPQPAQHP